MAEYDFGSTTLGQTRSSDRRAATSNETPPAEASGICVVLVLDQGQAHMDFYVSIFSSDFSANKRTEGSESFSLRDFKAGTASFASGPIWPKAAAALRRTPACSSFKASIKAGTMSLATGPIWPKLYAAERRT